VRIVGAGFELCQDERRQQTSCAVAAVLLADGARAAPAPQLACTRTPA